MSPPLSHMAKVSGFISYSVSVVAIKLGKIVDHLHLNWQRGDNKVTILVFYKVRRLTPDKLSSNIFHFVSLIKNSLIYPPLLRAEEILHGL